MLPNYPLKATENNRKNGFALLGNAWRDTAKLQATRT